MKKTKKEIISLVAAVVVVAAMLGALYWQRNRELIPEDDIPTPVGNVPLVQRSEADLVSVTFYHQGQTTVMLPFLDEEGRREWVWEGVDYILNTANARHKIRGTFSLFSSQVVHEDISEAEINLADFGLDPPYMTITAAYDDGTTVNLYMGSPTIDLSGQFIMIEGNPSLYTISRLNADRFLFELEDLIERSIPMWDAEAIEYILINQRGNETIEFKMEEHHEFEDLYWLIMQQPFPGREVYGMSFDYHIFEHFSAFVLGDMVNLHPTNLANYGLDNPSLEFIYRTPHEEIHLLFGDVFFKEVDGSEMAFIYVQFAGRPHVFEALYEPVSYLFDVNVLRFIERFIALVNIQEVERLEIITPGGDFDIWINHVEDGNDIAPTINDNPVTDSEFRLIYRLLIGLGIDSEIEPFTPRGAALYTTRFIMLEGDDIELRFFDYSDSFLAVSVNGEDIRFVTSRRNFDMFIVRVEEIG